MVLRVYVRLRIVKSFGWDDACIVAAMVSLVKRIWQVNEI
jgi:hypothetical protein